MRSICKRNLDNAQIYDMKFISAMSIIVVALAIIFSVTYSNIYIRYGIIVVAIIFTIIKRNMFISVLKEIKKKKAKTE